MKSNPQGEKEHRTQNEPIVRAVGGRLYPTLKQSHEASEKPVTTRSRHPDFTADGLFRPNGFRERKATTKKRATANVSASCRICALIYPLCIEFTA